MENKDLIAAILAAGVTAASDNADSKFAVEKYFEILNLLDPPECENGKWV